VSVVIRHDSRSSREAAKASSLNDHHKLGLLHSGSSGHGFQGSPRFTGCLVIGPLDHRIRKAMDLGLFRLSVGQSRLPPRLGCQTQAHAQSGTQIWIGRLSPGRSAGGAPHLAAVGGAARFLGRVSDREPPGLA